MTNKLFLWVGTTVWQYVIIKLMLKTKVPTLMDENIKDIIIV